MFLFKPQKVTAGWQLDDMDITKTYNFKFTDEALRNIDYLLPKLKFSVMPSKIVRWLENFDEVDIFRIKNK